MLSAGEATLQGTVGELEVRLKYLPFRATGAAPGAGGHEGGQEGASVQRPKPGQPSSEQSGSPSDSEKGILTVTLVRAFNLEVRAPMRAQPACQLFWTADQSMAAYNDRRRPRGATLVAWLGRGLATAAC